MITFVANFINFLALSIQSVFLFASCIGRIIVTLVTGVASAIFIFLRSVFTFLEIVYEDNISLFTEELPSLTNDVLATINNQWLYFQTGVSIIYRDMHYKFNSATNCVKYSFDAAITIICEVLLLLKTTVILLGDSIWFILTFIPVHLPQLLKIVFRYVTTTIVDAVINGYMSLLQITNFLTDVPLESFIGITSAIIIVRLFIHFRETICTHVSVLYWTLVRKLLYFYYALYNYFTNSEVRMISRMASGQDMRPRESSINSVVDNISDNVADDAANAADALCVICQERQKCVLTLPCRHVCLCTECCMRLYGYQRTCPICRTFIYHSVTVYL